MSIERYQEGTSETFTAIFRNASGSGITDATGVISIQRVSNRLYWNGSSFVAGAEILNAMIEVSEGSTPGQWDYDFTFPASDETYEINMKDSSGNSFSGQSALTAIVGGYVGNLNATISSRASEANATSNTTAINANIDANEVKIDIIDTNVDSILVDTNEMQGKLPTNNIMGSSVKTDKDDEIDAIKAKTDNLPADPTSETNATSNKSSVEAEVNGVADEVWDEALAGHLVVGSTGEALNDAKDGSGLTVGDIADAVLDEIVAPHNIIGSLGDVITDIDGKTTNLPADPASETNVDENETKLNALQATANNIDGKTNNLPVDPASESNVDANETKLNALQVTANNIDGKTTNLPVDPASESNVTAVGNAVAVNSNGIVLIKAKTDNLPADPASETNVDENETKLNALQATANNIDGKTNNLPVDPTSETNATANKDSIELAISNLNLSDSEAAAVGRALYDPITSVMTLFKKGLPTTVHQKFDCKDKDGNPSEFNDIFDKIPQ